MTKTKFAASSALIALLLSGTALASDKDTQELRAEIEAMRQSYESRIADLEAKLSKVEKATAKQAAEKQAPVVASKEENKQQEAVARRPVFDNSFNPSIGVILNGLYSNFSTDTSELKGFGIGEEGERGTEGFGLGESELNLSASVDDKFAGHLTAAIVSEDGEDKIELEESYIKTLPDAGLPSGLGVKAGRALWNFGYLNEHHAHSDDFADRPLPYRAFLNNRFNDDGIQLSYVLHTDIYTEVGGGAYRGDKFPAGSAIGESPSNYSAYARVGGDIGANQSWRLGASMLASETPARTTNEDVLTFSGDSNLYAADLRYIWLPTGNSKEQEVILQSEYMFRNEDGTYNDTDAATGNVAFDDNASGLYVQGIYKFMPQWRLGARYSMLQAPEVPAGLVGSLVDSEGHDPKAYSLMTDWTNSEFGRVRLQYNLEELSNSKKDNQFTVQYIMSIGAHGAHKY